MLGVPERPALHSLSSPRALILTHSQAWHLGACVRISGTAAKCCQRDPGASAKEPAAEGTGGVGSGGEERVAGLS